MAWWNPFSWGDESKSAKQKRANLDETGDAASQFAEFGQGQFMGLGAEAARARDGLRRIISGQDSLSREQLRQGMQSNIAAQRSMAASAAPSNAPMAALHAAQNIGRIGAGMSGQAALAGIQERQAAQQALAQMLLQERQQNLQAALGSRSNAVSAYGGITPEASTLEKLASPIAAGLGAAAKLSDERLKEEIEDGESEANRAMRAIRSFTYKYKDKKLGKDRELGIMAQDLERAGLKHTIIETPRGKAVHGAALATANTSMLAALERRVAKIEAKKKG